MKESFIKQIYIKDSRNVSDLNIPLSTEYRQHLILTGKNGSGKTSLLHQINKFLSNIQTGTFGQYSKFKLQLTGLEAKLNEILLSDDAKPKIEESILGYQDWFQEFGGTVISFSCSDKEVVDKFEKGNFILAYFDSKRNANLHIPQGISKVDLKRNYKLSDKANSTFLQYIVNLKADRSFAKDDNEYDIVDKIDKWFEVLEIRLKQIFDVNNLKLRFNRKLYNFDIVTDKHNTFNFNNLSDGYSAIISIVTELLLRMESHSLDSYEIEGIVVIDEIETHLHVDLQKKILPFLTDFFPKIQFIVTTHSPFVLSSLSNATICDLETRIVTTDLSAYSYDALLESYFDTDKYSEEVKTKIRRFEMLINTIEITSVEKEELKYLRNYFAHSPKYLSTKLLVKLQQIELKELNNR